MGVLPATVQPILRHSLITVTTGTYVEVIEAVKRDALDSMATLFETGCRRFVRPVVVNEAAVVVTVVVKTLESPTRKTAIFLVELRGFEPLTPHCQSENACAAACHSVHGVSDNARLPPVFVLMCLGRACR
jgi:hypothetical protein